MVCLYHSKKRDNSVHLKISFAHAKYSVINMKQGIIPLWTGKVLSLRVLILKKKA